MLTVMLSIQSCWWGGNDDDDFTPQQSLSAYTPIVVKRDVLEASTVFEASRPIVNSGKIYLKGTFLFVNERNEGFHVFNNANPENPINIGFLKIAGSSDLAIKDDIIYANNAVDLIAIEPDFSTSSISITKRIPNTFPQMISPDGFNYYNIPDDEIIINWNLTN